MKGITMEMMEDAIDEATKRITKSVIVDASILRFDRTPGSVDLHDDHDVTEPAITMQAIMANGVGVDITIEISEGR